MLTGLIKQLKTKIKESECCTEGEQEVTNTPKAIML